MFDLQAVQAALREFGFDGWLLCDFRGSNVLARRILDLESKEITSRRFFYCVPAEGEPKKLVHRIETGVLDHLPGAKQVYLKWQDLEQGIAGLVEGMKTVAMEYSPRNANPYISRVDAGTVELGLAHIADFGLVADFDLVAQLALHALVELAYLVGVPGVRQREHRNPVSQLGEALGRRSADALAGGVGSQQVRMSLFQGLQLAQQAVPLGVGDLRSVLQVVEAAVPVDRFDQLVHAALDIRLRS